MFTGDLVALDPPLDANHRTSSRGDQDVSGTGSQATNRPRILVANRPTYRLLARGDRGGGA